MIDSRFDMVLEVTNQSAKIVDRMQDRISNLHKRFVQEGAIQKGILEIEISDLNAMVSTLTERLRFISREGSIEYENHRELLDRLAADTMQRLDSDVVDRFRNLKEAP